MIMIHAKNCKVYKKIVRLQNFHFKFSQPYVNMVLMFFLCLTAAFDSVTVGNQLLYMLLWLLPEIILTYGLGR